MTPHEIICRTCSSAFARSGPYQSFLDCPSCEAAAKEADRLWLQETKKKDIAERYATVIPARYQGTRLDHPGFDHSLWNAVKQWRPTPELPWLGLVGTSGACKTRCAYLLLQELALETLDSSFTVTTSYEVAKAVTAQYQDSGGQGDDPRANARRLLRTVLTSSILILDDFGKAKNTPSYAAEVFAIFDHRHAHNLTTIWTSNGHPNAVVQGMPDDIAGPLAGRLIECSTIIPC